MAGSEAVPRRRRPEVPKDWLWPNVRWGVALVPPMHGIEFMDVESMDGYDEAGSAERQLWAAYRRAAKIQNALIIEIRSRMAKHGYRHFAELASRPDEDDPPGRRSQIDLSTLRNLTSGQRFISLTQIAELEGLLGPLLDIAPLDSSRDELEKKRNETASEKKAKAQRKRAR